MDDDVDNILEEGAGILSQWAHATDAKLTAEESALLISAAARLADTRLTAHQRLTAGDARYSTHSPAPSPSVWESPRREGFH